MKTADFGEPIVGIAQPCRCRICGCTETSACLIFDSEARPVHRACGWADHTKTLCDNPACVATARAELTTRPEEADLLQLPYSGTRYGFAEDRDRELAHAEEPCHLSAIDDKARLAFQQLSDKLEVAKRAAFAEGLDFAIGPVAPEQQNLMEVRDIFAPQKLTISCKAGAVDRSFLPPPGWVVYPNPDYREPGACDLGRGQEP